MFICGSDIVRTKGLEMIYERILNYEIETYRAHASSRIPQQLRKTFLSKRRIPALNFKKIIALWGGGLL